MIVAMGKNRVIGLNNQMPWHLPADLAYFKKTTLGKPIIMGRKTYESIGHPLPGRLNIVMSRDKALEIEGCTVVHSIEEALELAQRETQSDEVFITGGSHLYERYLKDIELLYITLIDSEFEGDTFFPDYTKYEWQEIKRDKYKADDKNSHSLTFLVLKRLRKDCDTETIKG